MTGGVASRASQGGTPGWSVVQANVARCFTRKGESAQTWGVRFVRAAAGMILRECLVSWKLQFLTVYIDSGQSKFLY